MVQQGREPFLLLFPRRSAHAAQPLGHSFPAPCRARVRLCVVLLGLRPSLHNLRRGLHPPLFGCFTGTTAQSGSSPAYMPGLRLFAFPDRPVGAGAKEVSRFCILFSACLGSSTTPSPVSARDLAPIAGVAFPLSEQGRRPVHCFRSSIAQPTDASVYASPAASQRPAQNSRSGWSRFSFPVGLFHPLQHAGLSRRSLSLFSLKVRPSSRLPRVPRQT
jgi:hypothetical protein